MQKAQEALKLINFESSVFEDSNILVLGANGFIGKNIIRKLSHKNVKLVGLTKALHLEGVKKVNESTFMISASPQQWESIIKKLRPKILISAEWEGVEGSSRNQIMQHNNIPRVLRFAHCAKEIGVDHFLTFGSQAEVGVTMTKITEESPLCPVTEYGKAKAKLLEELKEFFKNTTTGFTWVRLFSVYGEGMSDNWFIMDVIKKLLANEVFEMTKGDQEWNYLYVNDVISALEKIINFRTAGIVNVASESTIQLRDLAKLVGSKLGKNENLRIGAFNKDRTQPDSIKVDISKLTQLGWKEEINIEKGLEILIDYVRNQNNCINFDFK